MSGVENTDPNVYAIDPGCYWAEFEFDRPASPEILAIALSTMGFSEVALEHRDEVAGLGGPMRAGASLTASAPSFAEAQGRVRTVSAPAAAVPTLAQAQAPAPSPVLRQAPGIAPAPSYAPDLQAIPYSYAAAYAANIPLGPSAPAGGGIAAPVRPGAPAPAPAPSSPLSRPAREGAPAPRPVPAPAPAPAPSYVPPAGSSDREQPYVPAPSYAPGPTAETAPDVRDEAPLPEKDYSFIDDPQLRAAALASWRALKASPAFTPETRALLERSPDVARASFTRTAAPDAPPDGCAVVSHGRGLPIYVCGRDVLKSALVNTKIGGAAARPTYRYAFLGRLASPITIRNLAAMRWLRIVKLPLDPFSSMTFQLHPFVVKRGQTAALRFLSRDKSVRAKADVQNVLSAMGFSPNEVFLVRRNMRIPGRSATSVSEWVGFGTWNLADSVVTCDDPFYFADLRPVL